MRLARRHRQGKQNPPASVAQTGTPRSSSRPESSPGIRSEIVPLPPPAPSRLPGAAGREATIQHMGLPGTAGEATPRRSAAGSASTSNSNRQPLLRKGGRSDEWLYADAENSALGRSPILSP